MTEARVRRRLDDLGRFGAEADYLGAKGREAYVAETMDGAMLRNAGERILIKTATVAEKLPDEFKAQHPGVDWTGINRMRNLVAHHDDKVNDDLLGKPSQCAFRSLSENSAFSCHAPRPQ